MTDEQMCDDAQRCDDDKPHDGHVWSDSEGFWWCKGRKAHALTMIGREGE